MCELWLGSNGYKERDGNMNFIKFLFTQPDLWIPMVLCFIVGSGLAAIALHSAIKGIGVFIVIVLIIWGLKHA